MHGRNLTPAGSNPLARGWQLLGRPSSRLRSCRRRLRSLLSVRGTQNARLLRSRVSARTSLNCAGAWTCFGKLSAKPIGLKRAIALRIHEMERQALVTEPIRLLDHERAANLLAAHQLLDQSQRRCRRRANRPAPIARTPDGHRGSRGQLGARDRARGRMELEQVTADRVRCGASGIVSGSETPKHPQYSRNPDALFPDSSSGGFAFRPA